MNVYKYINCGEFDIEPMKCWYCGLDVHFPYAKLDIRGANVLIDEHGNLFCTDPVWNNDEDLPTVYIPYISKYPSKPLNNINQLRQELTHGRVW